MNMLRLLSERATQRFTYFCSGSVAYEDNDMGNTKKAIELLGNNDFDFKTGRFNKRQVEHDGCKVGSLLFCSTQIHNYSK